MVIKKIFFVFIIIRITSSYSQESQNYLSSSTNFCDNKISISQNDALKVKTAFKPERLVYEIAVGASASFVSTIFGGLLGRGIAGVSGETGPWAGIEYVLIGGYIGYCIGGAGGVYLVSKRYNKNVQFYEYSLAALATGGTAIIVISSFRGKNIWALLLPLPVTILYSQIFYPSQIEIKSEQQLMHGQIHNNFTLSIPIGN